ncbi:hypothetical protein SHJGH_5250 [Streptomyces hygroscopicus subsp. jinggangensis TL01]|nr:hypothetical protein SHJGH_5250 [Streptomyces hygroscopicus subsp. jinggangensis TL01]
MMTVRTVEELARLHRLISWYDVPLNLPSAALAGEACVWCTSPADATAVELDPSNPLPRRGCLLCYAARVAWYVSWYDWHSHFESCTHCQQRKTCYIGHGRRLLHEQTIGPADRSKPKCAACPAPVLSTELVAPLHWQGTTHQIRLGYAHMRCLTGKARVR